MEEQTDSPAVNVVRDIEKLIVDDADFAKLERLLNPFNIFEALGIVSQEKRHSDFLAFLCDPSQNHGLGDTFVRRFLQKATVGTTGPLSPIRFDIYDMESIGVRREWHSIDLLLVDQSNKLAVIVENKIHSGEHGNQLERYWDSVQMHFPGHATLGLFLSPDGSMPSDDRYVPVGYGVVADLVESIASSAVAEAQSLMIHYSNMLRRHVVEDSQLADLCRSIYRRHRSALDRLFEYRYDRQDEIKGFLTQLIGETTGPQLSLDGSSKTLRQVLPNRMGFIAFATPRQRLDAFGTDAFVPIR